MSRAIDNGKPPAVASPPEAKGAMLRLTIFVIVAFWAVAFGAVMLAVGQQAAADGGPSTPTPTPTATPTQPPEPTPTPPPQPTPPPVEAPRLTVHKVVVNDNGGTAAVADFVLWVGGDQFTSGVSEALTIGAHLVSETGPAGYIATYSGDCDAQGALVLGAGDVASCTITNDDVTPTPTPTPPTPPVPTSTPEVRATPSPPRTGNAGLR